MLGWKRIKGSDVSQCYQQAAGLAMLVADEIEKNLMIAFLGSIHDKEEKRLRLNRYISNADLSVDIASEFLNWIQIKIENSSDQCFVMVCNYVYLMTLYRSFRFALRYGDSIMIEWLYKEFLPIFLVTGKVNYFDIILGMMDNHYGVISSELLHYLRCNRTVPLYEGNDKFGNEMAHWALDAIIENIQKFYHQMNFKNDIGGWFRHSSNVMLINRCNRFVRSEYSLQKSIDSSSIEYDISESTKKTSVPKRTSEKVAIAEYLNLVGITKEDDKRMYDDKFMLSKINDITTKLEDESEEERRSRWEDSLKSESEVFIDDMTDRLFSIHNKDQNEDVINETNESVTMDFEDIGIDTNSEIFDDSDNENHVIKRKVRINSLCFEDFISKGIKMMKNKNLEVTRKRKNERIRRENVFRQKVFNLFDDKTNSSENISKIEAFRRLGI